MKTDVEGAFGDLAIIEAVRQVKVAKSLMNRSNVLAAKDEEIQQLQEQLEVKFENLPIFCDINYLCVLTSL